MRILWWVLLILTNSVFVHAQRVKTYTPLTPITVDGKWGYVDTLGELRISALNYDSVRFFQGRSGPDYQAFAKVFLKGKEGLIGLDGEAVLPPLYDYVTYEPYKRKQGDTLVVADFLLSLRDSSYTVHDLSGAVRLTDQDEIRAFWNTRRKRELPRTTPPLQYWPVIGHQEPKKTVFQRIDSIPGRLLKKYNLDSVDRKLSVKSVLSRELSYLYGFRSGLPVVIDLTREEEVALAVDEILGIYDYWPDMFPDMAADPALRVYFLVRKGDHYGVLRRDGKPLIPVIYDDIAVGVNAILATEFFLKKDGKFGVYMVTNNYPQIEPKYNTIAPGPLFLISRDWIFKLFRVELDGRFGYVGENGVEFFNQ